LKIVAHASPLVLERELLDRVSGAKAADPLAAVLIVVPSRRLADHVSQRLVDRFGSVLGVSVLDHRSLAIRVLEHAGTPSRPILDEHLQETLFTRVVRRAPSGPLRDFVRDHPGAAGAMLATLTDLREAGIDPAAAARTLTGPEAETASLFARWSEALDAIGAGGTAIDDAALVRAATPHAAAFGARFAHILHHGAYDLIGVRVELVRALDRGGRFTFLLPADPVEDSGLFGVRRASAWTSSPSAIAPLTAHHAPPPVSWLHAQGARAELQSAVYEALSAVNAGAPPHEVAIVVRSFAPYAAAMDALLDDGQVSWHTSYVQPLRRDPRAAAALRAIASGDDRGPRGWAEHAGDFERLAPAENDGAALAPLYAAMRGIAELLGDDRPVSRREAASWLEARADATRVRPAGADGGGVRVLDAMQARGLTFAQLNLAGMNAGVFPRVSHPDPFLSDASRLRLREATGRPLPVAAESDGEERLLLTMLMGATRDRLNVSWRRADESARPVVASLALGAVARFAGLGEDAHEAEGRARSLPAHPRSRLEAWADAPGLLEPRDEALLTALASETGADAGPAVAGRRPEWSHGVALVAATESFAPTSGAYDARVGRSALGPKLAATALERLGRCPLQFFFRHALKVTPVPRPATPFATDPAAVGTRVHAVLHDVYRRLVDEGSFAGDDLDLRVARARTLLREAWGRCGDTDTAARAARFPLLDRIETGVWIQTLDAFLAADLARLAAEGLIPASFEFEDEGSIPGAPPGLSVTVRYDRVVARAGGRVVSDYKTGGDLAARVKPAAMLSGEQLQVPVYALIAEAPVELLGAGPKHEAGFARFDDFASPAERDGVLETIRVALGLAVAGTFPLHADAHCAWCDFRPACRNTHPPTAFREAQADDARDARDCWDKSAKLPLLAAVRAEREP